jgi:hypothetical protein
MSNDVTALMNFLSFGNTSEDPDSDTYALLFSEKSVEIEPGRTTITCNGVPLFVTVRKGLLPETEESPVDLKGDFEIRIYSDIPPSQPVPPVIIRGNGSLNGLFSVIVENGLTPPPRKLTRPINPYSDQYLVKGESVYAFCDVSPSETEPVQSFSIESGFSLLLRGTFDITVAE